MKSSYTFAVLRYVHDPVGGEFANVGVLLYAPTATFLRVQCSFNYGRVSKFFGRIDGDHYRSLLRQIDKATAVLRDQLFESLPFRAGPNTAEECLARILPRDDSSLQFEAGGAGLSSNLETTAQELFERFVTRYSDGRQRTRSDDDVLASFRHSLQERHLVAQFQPKRISAPLYEHEFPMAWKNGSWNTYEAASFDLLEGSDIVEKANRWLGRAINLQESPEPFHLYLILGNPTRRGVIAAFDKAVRILEKMPLDKTLVSESDVPKLATNIAATIEGSR